MQTEQSVTQLKEELRLAHSLIKSLSQSNQDLTEAVRIRDEFLSIASHELKTPLTPLRLQIQGFLHAIKKNGNGVLNEERVIKMASTCEKSISRLNDMLDNLLDVSRFNLGRLTLNLQTLDLVDLAKNILENHRPHILELGITVDFINHEPLVGLFDGIRLEQVFQNLLTNAMKYGNKKPVSISIFEENGEAHISFTDQGIGIPETELGQIFQIFKRVENTSNISGFGLGLFIAQQIVEAHGGQINVQSNLDQGSKFTVNIPIRKTELQ